jgi:hypothetical protein
MQSAGLIESVDRRGNAYKSCRPFELDFSKWKRLLGAHPPQKRSDLTCTDMQEYTNPLATMAGSEGSDEASGSFYLPYGKSKKGNLGSLCTNFWPDL